MNAGEARTQSSAHVDLVGEIQRSGGRLAEIARHLAPDSVEDGIAAAVVELSSNGAVGHNSEVGLLVAGMTGGNRGTRAIKACREAGFPVINPEDCTCGLAGRLVVLAGPDGLRIVWPYEQRCPIHDARDRDRPQPVTRAPRPSLALASRHTRMDTRQSERAMIRAVPDLARTLAGRLDALFTHDATLARRLNDAQRRLQNANDRLWWGAHPDGLAAVYGEHPAAVDVAFAEHRSEVLGAADRLAAIQQVRWQIHRAFIAYQTIAEERRQLAAEIGELVRQLVDALLTAGWTEEQARNTNVHELVTRKPATHRRN